VYFGDWNAFNPGRKLGYLMYVKANPDSSCLNLLQFKEPNITASDAAIAKAETTQVIDLLTTAVPASNEDVSLKVG
jgi:hypothetical protein